jgi:heme-degrading monooxygenase HmoA
MVARIWRGYTTLQNADAYENFLKTEFLPAVEAKKIPGYKQFELLRKDDAEEISFITIMWFESIEHIRNFAGEDYQKAVVHPKAQALLKRYDKVSEHYEIKHKLHYP